MRKQTPSRCCVALALFSAPLLAMAQTAAAGAPRPPNSSPAYQELRSLMPVATGITVQGFDLKRDQAVLHFASGSFWFYATSNGKDTGAVFEGTGSFELSPESASERHNLQTVLKTEHLHLDFTTAVLRFTDGTADELRKASKGEAAPSTQPNGAANSAHDLFRSKFHYNLEERLLQDVLSTQSGGFFLAEFKSGGMLGKQFVYMVDPQDTPDQVELYSSGQESDEFDTAASFPMAGGDIKGDNHPTQVRAESIDTTIANNGYLTGKAEMKVTARRDGVRVLPIPLYATLRMGGVFDADGTALDFIQESKDKDPQFAVILPKVLKAGEETTLTFHYEGKDLVKAEGQGNFYPVGRTSWYPSPSGNLSQYVTYDLTFRVPKDIRVVATGNKVSEKVENGQTVTVWHTKDPITVPGFNMGRFKSADVESPDKLVDVQAYANEELPDTFESYKRRYPEIVGALNSTSMLKTALNEGAAAIQVYDDYFGPLAYDHIAITQQAACNYGQSWPMLVYLPICYFFDSTFKHIFGLDEGNQNYWNNVLAHEVSHQWWGQTVGYPGYRDQWMSEGFADWSAGLYLQRTRKTMDDYHAFWKYQQKLVTQKNTQGVRPNDVGPLTMGYRVNSSKAGYDVYRDLIYGKGSYIPHMLELMFYTNAEGNTQFKKTMQDFVSTYRNRTATTQDFQAVVEKHMPRTMDLDHNGKLDWFFNEWVNGTELPHYTCDSNVITEGGTNELHFKVTQSGVSESFKMLVPLYLETKDGRILRIATLPMVGNSTLDKTVNLPSGMDAKRALINAYEDVLSD